MLNMVIATFRFNCQYECEYEYDLLDFEVVLCTTRSSAILIVNKMSAI